MNAVLMVQHYKHVIKYEIKHGQKAKYINHSIYQCLSKRPLHSCTCTVFKQTHTSQMMK